MTTSFSRLAYRSAVIGAAMATIAVILLVPTSATTIPVSPTMATSALPIVDLECNIAFQFNFGSLSLTATQATGAGTFCISPNGSATALSGNTFTGTGTATTCPQLTITGAGSITWITTTLTTVTSTFTFLVNINPLNGVPTLNATITSGALAGDIATAVPVTALVTPARCPGGLVPGFARIASPEGIITFQH
jgi:hypothetical protein